MNRLQRVLKHLPSVPLLVYAGLLFAALYLFAELAGEIYEQERFAFDAPILTWLDLHQTPLLTGLARSLSWLGSIYVLGPVAVGLAYAFWRRSVRAAAFFVLSVGGAVAVNLFAKSFFARARPELFDALSPATNFSFPSGHTMGSTAFALALYLVVRKRSPEYRWPVAVGGFLFALGVSLSRSYLQVHYPSDILAGWTLSIAWVLGVNAWYGRPRYRSRPHSYQGKVDEDERVTPNV